VPKIYAEFLRTNPQLAAPGTLGARIAAGEPVVHVLDRKAEAAYREGEPHRRASVDLGGGRTTVAVPLTKDRRLVGAIEIYRQHVEAFSDKQIALLQNFAAQAVIAMENARLIAETREALEQQTATAEVLGVINSSPGDLAPVFDVLLERATRLCEASFGYLLTYDGERLHPAADRGHPSFAAWIRAHIQAQNPHKPEPGTSNARLLAGEDVVHIPDITDDAGVSENSLVRRALIEIGGFRTILSIALRREGSLLGIIHIYRQEVRPFTDKQIALLQNFAAQAVIAMENARLLAELRQRTDEVAELNRGLEARVAEQVDELGRVGRLKRFLAPQLAELIVSQGDEKILESHRREIVVVFCDLRGYTAFTETAEPEEVLDFLRE
ncbi:MAG TPA: GAF domain-containing protein, partial [Gemmatimonadaceae bacterium]|nr:GAF domain-containing protein [Gemmatimonadaceae bacterium]